MIVRTNQKLCYSIPNPSWGDVSIISQELVDKVDLFCQEIDSRVVVTPHGGTGGVHKADWHARGMAVDIIPEKVISNPHLLFDCFISATRFGFGGIGIYPYWKYNGAIVGGLHLDVRQSTFTAYWMGIQGQAGEQTYIELNYENLKAHGF